MACLLLSTLYKKMPHVLQVKTRIRHFMGLVFRHVSTIDSDTHLSLLFNEIFIKLHIVEINDC